MNSSAERREQSRVDSALRTLRFLLKGPMFNVSRAQAQKEWEELIPTIPDLRLRNSEAWKLVFRYANQLAPIYLRRAQEISIRFTPLVEKDTSYLTIMSGRKIAEGAINARPLATIRLCVYLIEQCRNVVGFEVPYDPLLQPEPEPERPVELAYAVLEGFVHDGMLPHTHEELDRIWNEQVNIASSASHIRSRAWHVADDTASLIAGEYQNVMRTWTDRLNGNKCCNGLDYVKLKSLREVIELMMFSLPLEAICLSRVVIRQCKDILGE